MRNSPRSRGSPHAVALRTLLLLLFVLLLLLGTTTTPVAAQETAGNGVSGSSKPSGSEISSNSNSNSSSSSSSSSSAAAGASKSKESSSAHEEPTTQPPAGSIRWAILLDLTRTTLTLASLKSAVQLYISSSLGTTGQTLFASEPTILNSDGNMITALSLVSELVLNPNTFPAVLFMAETADVSTAVSDVLRQNDTTADILIVSAHTSNAKLCDPTTNPHTMCMVPRDLLNVRGLLEITSSQLRWSSMAMVFSNTGYGQGVQANVASQVQAATTTPTVVAEVFMNPSSSTTDDDALLAQIMTHKPKGIACFLSEAQMRRFRSAVSRSRWSGSVFLLGSREALNLLPQLTGSYQPLISAWGALFVSSYTSVDSFVRQHYFTYDLIDDYGAYVVSHLFDGMKMVALAGGTTSMAALRAVNFAGFSGTVAFDPVYYQRVETTFSLVMQQYPVSMPLLTWYVQSYSTPTVIHNEFSATIAALIPASPLRSVTVCMTSPTSCADTEMMSSMLFVLLNYNAQTASDDTKVNFLPIAINTGESGVVGLSSLIPVARTCTLLTGPGTSSVTQALTAVINEFQITQVDYNTANSYFTSDAYSFPYFSRTIPANSFSYRGFGEVCAHFAWERVILITTNDQFGISRAAAMTAAMQRRNVYVENTYYLDENNGITISTVLDTIYKKDVSRILHILLPLSGTKAKAFFDLVDTKSFMRNYVFFLSKDLCLYGATHPESRAKLQSSICMLPYVPPERITAINEALSNSTAVQQEIRTVLSDGGFLSQAETCDIATVHNFSGFAVDAGYLIISAVERAVAAGVSLDKSATLRQYIRGTTLNNFTGQFTISSIGERDFAAYYVDIQVKDSAVTIGTWSERQTPALRTSDTSAIYWMTNSTTVPLDTFRDISFVLGTTVSASPGTIVLSVLGFVGTIGVFFFCYRHYRMQKLVEITLEGSDVPITDDELRRLRAGIKDEV